MTARMLCLVTLFVAGAFLSRPASASQWLVPKNAAEQRDLLASLLQNSEYVVLARIDKDMSPESPLTVCTALEYLKGSRFPNDRFSYNDVGDRVLIPGDRYLLFLTRSAKHGLVLTRRPYRYRVTADDSILVRYRQYATSWTAYRDSLVVELTSLTPAGLTASADFALRGTVAQVNLTGTTRRKHGSLGITVKACYTTPPAADTGSVILVEFPSPVVAPFTWFDLPPASSGQDVILFLDRMATGHFVLHGGLYGMWIVGGDSARVMVPAPYDDGQTIHLSTFLTDSLLATLRKR